LFLLPQVPWHFGAKHDPTARWRMRQGSWPRCGAGAGMSGQSGITHVYQRWGPPRDTGMSVPVQEWTLELYDQLQLHGLWGRVEKRWVCCVVLIPSVCVSFDKTKRGNCCVNTNIILYTPYMECCNNLVKVI